MHTYNVMEGLHTARFANAPLRWLFFLSGLMGCAMVATGLLLWAVKERPQHLKVLKRGEKGRCGSRPPWTKEGRRTKASGPEKRYINPKARQKKNATAAPAQGPIVPTQA